MSYLALFPDRLLAMHAASVVNYRTRSMTLGITAQAVPAPPLLYHIFPQFPEVCLTHEAIERFLVVKDYMSLLFDPASEDSVLRLHPVPPTEAEQDIRIRRAPQWNAAYAEFDRRMRILAEADEEDYLAACNLFEHLLHGGIMLLADKDPMPCPTLSTHKPGGEWADLRVADCTLYNTEQADLFEKIGIPVA